MRRSGGFFVHTQQGSPRAGESLVSSVVMAKAVEQLVAWGVNVGPILREVGVAHEDLAQTDGRLPLRAFTSLLELAAQETGSPHLGLKIAAAIDFEALGPLGRLMASASTPLAALRVLERYIGTYQDATIQRVQFDDESATFIYLIEDNRVIHRAQDAEFSIGLVFQILVRRYQDRRPFEVLFEHAPIGRWQDYDYYFGCPVFFNQRANALVFKPAALHEPLPVCDDASAQATRDRLEDMLSRQPRTTAAAIVAHIHEQSLESGLTFAKIAEAFGTSVSTLGRRLAREGISYRTLLDHARKEMAERLLSASNLSVSEIALQLGYSENATFSRSFHRWTGTSPRQFRKHARRTGARISPTAHWPSRMQ